VYGSEYSFLGLYLLCGLGLTLCSPLLLHKLISLAEDPARPMLSITGYVALLFSVKLCGAILNTQYAFLTGVMSVRVKAAIQGNLFHKVLRLSTQSKRHYTTGTLSNLYTTDIERITDMVVQGHRFWALPVQIMVSMVVLFFVVSYAMLFGLAAIILVMTFNRYIAYRMKKENDLVQKAKDERMSDVSACFNSSLVIKLNAWELKFQEKIFGSRAVELRHIWNCMFLGAVNICLLWLAPCLVSTATIASYATMSEDIQAAEIFTALSLFKSLQDPFRDLPGIITQYFQMQTSLERLQKLYYMNEKEFDTFMQHEAESRGEAADAPAMAVVVDRCVLFWGSTDVEDDTDGDKKEAKLLDESERSDMDKSTGVLLTPDRDANDSKSRAGKAGPVPEFVIESAEDLEVELGDAEVDNNSLGFRLQFPVFEIQKGEVIAITGQTGAGKSSVISALLGNMYVDTDSPDANQHSPGEYDAKDISESVPLRLHGTVSYASQQAWIQNESFLENILMGMPQDDEKLRRVIDACALRQDLIELGSGLSQQIGEKGVGLSGGQKARVALARAMYADTDIVLLDDVFAALDVTVGRHVFQKGVVELMRGKTIIMVTHNKDILGHGRVDGVVKVVDGVVEFSRGEVPRSRQNSDAADAAIPRSRSATYDAHNSHGKCLVSQHCSIAVAAYSYAQAPWPVGADEVDVGAGITGAVVGVTPLSSMSSLASIQPKNPGSQGSSGSLTLALPTEANRVDDPLGNPESASSPSQSRNSNGRKMSIDAPSPLVTRQRQFSIDSNLSDVSYLDDLNSEDRLRRNHSFYGRPVKRDDAQEHAGVHAKSSSIPSLPSAEAVLEKKKTSTVRDEERAEGNISMDVYLAYINAMGGKKMLIFLTCIQCCWQGLSVSGDLWLSYWTNHSDSWQQNHVSRNILVYSVLSLGSGFTVFIRTCTIASGGYRASKSLFEQMTRALLHAPMSWLDINPSGRILNRFSHDMSKVDMDLPYAVGGCFACVFSALGTLLAVSVITKWLVIVAIPIGWLYGDLMGKYVKASREIQREQQTSQSPVLSFMSEVSAGATIVNAYCAVPRFIDRNDEKINLNSQMVFMSQAAQAWFVIRVQALGACVLLFICIFAFGQLGGAINPSLVGLSLSYGLAISDQLQFVVMLLSWFENSMVCPERVLQYCNIPQEGTEFQKQLFRGQIQGGDAKSRDPSVASAGRASASGDSQTGVELSPMHKSYVTNGAIEFRDVCFRYQPDSEDVLSRLSFNVKGGEKIGIVGRTGSGKSSLSMSLFRVAELSSGAIFIDGHDCSEMSLLDLRSSIEIIPQAPVVLKGSVRLNIDPFTLYSDEAVYKALEKACLVKTVTKLYEQQQQSRKKEANRDKDKDKDKGKASSHKNKNSSNSSVDATPAPKAYSEYSILGALLDESGGNLSVGEKQLLVMSRALLANSKILVMDEATANIDNETDEHIQRLLEHEFRDSTVLTIAHRLHTIMQSHRILVMSNGQVAEYDSPASLMAQPASIFANMAAEQAKQHKDKKKHEKEKENYRTEPQ